MEEEDNNKINFNSGTKRKALKYIIVSIILIAIVIFVLFKILVPYKGCDSWECFNKAVEKCTKTKFAGGRDIVFGYTIEGKKDGTCEVIVEYLQGDIANKNAKELESKKMSCYTPLETIMLPESDLSNCHGELKEKLQEQIISELHTYIIDNLGEINKGILNPLVQNSTG